jgi:hypothetical protein
MEKIRKNARRAAVRGGQDGPRCSSARARRSGRSARRGRPDLPISAHGRNASTSISTQAGPPSLPTTASAGLWSANRPRPGCVDGRPVLVPVTGDRDRDLRDLPWAGACGGERAAEIGERLPGQAARPVLIPGWRSPRAPCRFPSRWPAPSWLVRVGTCLALHLPAGSHRLCLDRPGLLLHELGRRLFAILSGPGAKEAHSAAKKTHSGIIGRRLADFSHPEGQISRHVQVVRACQRRSDEWPGCEYRDDRQANRRCYRRVVAQCHAESDQRSGRRRLRSSGLGRPRLAARLAPRQPADHAL